jgi:hypothetical protein
MSNPGSTEDAARSDETAAWRWTIVVALVAPVAVFFALAWTTSDADAERREIVDWRLEGRPQSLAGGDVEFELQERPTRLVHPLAPEELGRTAFAFEFGNPSAAPVQITVFVSADAPGARPPTFRPVLVTRLEPGEARRVLRVTVENDRELADARIVAVGMRALAWPARVVFRSAALDGASFAGRVGAMSGALLRAEPLSSRTNNFMPGPSLAGLGFGAVCWIAWSVLVAVLVARRWAGAKGSLGAHVALGTVVLFLVIDARNWADGWGRARSAIERHREARSLAEELAPLEPSPWFVPALERLRAATDAPRTFAIERAPTETRDLIGEAEDLRLAYYAHPARAAARASDASLVVVVGAATSAIESDPRFHATATFTDGSRILERAP